MEKESREAVARKQNGKRNAREEGTSATAKEEGGRIGRERSKKMLLEVERNFSGGVRTGTPR